MNETAHRVRTERPWSKRVPADRDHAFDAIVVGSGIGGMTTAATLAKLGKKVLVLEQHYVPGGYTHVFRRAGYHWDVGVHLVGEWTTRSLVGRVLHGLTDGKLQWQPIGDVYDSFRFPDDFGIAFPSEPTAFADTLKQAFPHEAANVDRYMALVRQTVKDMRGYYLAHALPGPVGRMLGGYVGRDAMRWLTVTAQTVLEDLFDDPRLRAVVAAQWGYHGSPPSQVAWGLQALIVRHFQWGAAYPVGGASEIARHMLKTVADAGGWTRICADVDEILVEDGRAVGVRLQGGEEIRAPRVVSAAGAVPTVARLLPATMRDHDWVRRVRSHAAGPAHVCLYLGFKGDVRAAGATPESQWTYQTWDHEQAFWDVHPDRPLETPGCIFTSFPSLKDPAHDPGPEQRHTGEMITFVPWEPFQRWADTRWRRRGDDYEAFKARMTEKLLEVLFRQHPGLEPLLDHHELATPLSTDLFVRPFKGSIYGLAHTPDRFQDPWLRCQSPVPGLFLSGSDVASCGVMGAMMGGLMCAVTMEPIRTIRWVGGLKPDAPSFGGIRGRSTSETPCDD